MIYLNEIVYIDDPTSNQIRWGHGRDGEIFPGPSLRVPGGNVLMIYSRYFSRHRFAFFRGSKCNALFKKYNLKLKIYLFT